MSNPADGGRLRPRSSLTLTFARPVADVLGSRLPRLVPATRGRWKQLDRNTLSFEPAGFGFALDSTVHVRLPGQSLAWHVAGGSTLRLQELLARAGYLPLRWQAAAAPPSTPAAEVSAAVSAPKGTFTWRFPKTPVSLRTLWKPGSWSVIMEGAVMRFQQAHGLATDGVPGPVVWRALLRDDERARIRGFVLNKFRGDPQLLLPGPALLEELTGVPVIGVVPWLEHGPVGTMSGTNPDGSHYNDPGIKWISYFHGGDALHAFPRASFGTPQSLGCVELPEDAAARVWPYTPIGTLVTIES